MTVKLLLPKHILFNRYILASCTTCLFIEIFQRTLSLQLSQLVSWLPFCFACWECFSQKRVQRYGDFFIPQNFFGKNFDFYWKFLCCLMWVKGKIGGYLNIFYMRVRWFVCFRFSVIVVFLHLICGVCAIEIKVKHWILLPLHLKTIDGESIEKFLMPLEVVFQCRDLSTLNNP